MSAPRAPSLALADHQIPLIVGVTGHRTLPDDEFALRALVAPACDALRAAFPHTPVLVLSSLAEGADRLLARMILERLDAHLVAPLPLPPDDYGRDFATDTSRREFADLLAQAERWFVVPQEERRDLLRQPGEARSRQYARAGAWVVEHCHVLVALWDEAEARGTGGTAHVVRWKREGRVPREFSSLPGGPDPLAAPEPGLMILVNPAARTVTRTPVPDAGAFDILGRLEIFNRDLADRFHSKDTTLWEPRQALGAGVPPDPDPGRDAIIARFAAADLLSGHFQRRDRAAIACVHGIFAAAMVFYGLIDWVPWFVAIHVVSLPMLFVLITLVRRGKIEERALDYRALAEGLRVLLFWTVTGVQERVSASYLGKHASIVAWIRLAVRAVEIASGATIPDGRPGRGPAAVDFARRAWITDQRRYFADRRHRLAWWSGVTGAVTGVAFALACVAAVAYLGFVLGENVPANLLVSLSSRVGLGHNGYQAALGLCGAVAVATEAYRKRRAFPELARQYAAAERLFATAEERFAEGELSPDAILTAIGREALIEHGEWLWLHRSQPLDLPRG